MDNLNKIEIAARNKANYLKAKEAFNNKRVDECILFYAADHEVKSKQSEKGRDGIRKQDRESSARRAFRETDEVGFWVAVSHPSKLCVSDWLSRVVLFLRLSVHNVRQTLQPIFSGL